MGKFDIPLEYSIWGSGTRIYAGYRLAMLGVDEANTERPAIPPDVATAADELRRRQIVSMAQVVNYVHQFDDEANDRFGTALGLQSGQSVFDPIYTQYAELEASPVMAEYPNRIWNDMPQRLYLMNRAGTLTDEERTVLEDLYAPSYAAAQAGTDPFLSSTDDVDKAVEARKLLAGSNEKWIESAVNIAPKLAKIAFTAIGVFAVGYGAYRGIDALSTYIKEKPASDAAVAEAEKDAKFYEFQIRNSERNDKLIDTCLAYAQANGQSPEQCMSFQRAIIDTEPPLTPSQAAAGGTACESGGGCSTWIILSGGLGLIAGYMASKRLFGEG